MRRGEFYEGYRLNGYDCAYERTMIELVEKEIDGTRVIEMEDVNSGIRLMVSIKKGEENERKTIFNRNKKSRHQNHAEGRTVGMPKEKHLYIVKH